MSSFSFIKSDSIPWECVRKDIGTFGNAEGKKKVKWLVFLGNLNWQQELGPKIVISLPGNLYLYLSIYITYTYIFYIF